MSTDDLIKQARLEVENEQHYRDGIPQIIVGVYFVFLALMMLARANSAVTVVFIPMISIMIEGLRRRITYPRVGYAKIREQHSMRRVIPVMLIALLLGVGAAVFVLVTRNSDPTFTINAYRYSQYAIALTVLILAVILIIRRPRKIFVIYAVSILVILALVFHYRLDKDGLYYLMLGFGVVNLVIGLVNLFRFVKSYPVMNDHE